MPTSCWLGRPSRAQDGAAVGQVVEERDLLRDAQGVVPGHDDRPGRELDAARAAGEPRQELQVVGAGGVVREVVLDRPELVEAELLAELRDPLLVADDLLVAELALVVLEDEQQADVHGGTSRPRESIQ